MPTLSLNQRGQNLYPHKWFRDEKQYQGTTINQCEIKMRTFQLQWLHNKSQNSKWKHQYCLHPKCITPTKMTSNLFMKKKKIKSEGNSKTSKKRQMRRKMLFQVFCKQATYSHSTFNYLPCLRDVVYETKSTF